MSIKTPMNFNLTRPFDFQIGKDPVLFSFLAQQGTNE
jgi:hypothetical protein